MVERFMLPYLYLAAFFISLIEVILFYESSLGKNNQKRMFLFVVSLVANYGNAMLSFSETYIGALCGTQFYFIGSTLTFVFFFFVIADICSINLSKKLERFLFLVAFVIMVLVAICDHTTLFFKNMYTIKYFGATVLCREYGVLYFLYPTFIFLMNLGSIIVIIIAINRGNKISEKTVRSLLVILLTTDMATVLSLLLKVPFEIYPFINIVLLGFLLGIFRHASMYDMTENLINVYSQRHEYGYISFDRKKKYLGCNEYALTLIPELRNAKIDEYLDDSQSPYYATILSWIEAWENGKQINVKISNDGITAMAAVRYIRNGKKPCGYLIEMTDVTSQQRYVDNLEGNKHNLELEIEEKARKIVHIQDSIITGIASMVESRDNSTGDHIRRTSEGVRIFVDQLKKHPDYSSLSDSFYLNVIKAAPMHDLGKIAVSDSILKKPGKFTPDEHDQMKKHTTEGAKIVTGVLREVDDEEFKRIAVNIAHYHHEKWNGSGYPEGLKGEEIPIEARIMAFADVFDALVTKRCYKEAMDYNSAFELMENDFGTHFDPRLGKVFLECKVPLAAMYTLDVLLNKEQPNG